MQDGRERAVMKVARRQHNVFSLAQALEAGFTRPAIRRRLRSTRWEELEPRAYRLALGTQPDPRQLLMARTLSTRGVASGRSAGGLYGFLAFPPSPEVTIVRSSKTGLHSGVRYTDELPKADVVTVDGIRATSPARTVIDLGSILTFDEFEDVFDLAILTGAVRRHRLETRARELWAPRRSGCALALQLLADRNPELASARNLWEARVLRIFERLRVPRPRVNYPVRVGVRLRRLDLAWPEHKLFAELDGFAAHAPRRAFEDDRERQNLLVADDWRPFRLTKRALERDTDAALAPIVAALKERRRWSLLGAPPDRDRR